MIIQNYNLKEETYFTNTRLDILPSLPKYYVFILEIRSANWVALKHMKNQEKYN